MNIQFPEPTATAIIADQLAALFDPGDEVTPSQWAAKNLVVPDGPRAGELFNIDLTPYLVEPLDFFADACPDNKAAVRKSKQTGFTTLAIAAFGYTADREPCDMFLIEPTKENLNDFVGEKLQRAIENSPALQRKVRAQTSRSSKGSTTKSKKYAGGSMLMAIATSSADLRGKTRKKIIRDEASEYPVDLNGQGSPHDMIAGAYESFLANGDWKDLAISTPVIKGACYIDKEFEAGDQRYWHVKCPGCADEFYFTRDPKHFRFNKSYPYQAHYIAPCCGTVIEGWQRNDLVRAGRWIAIAPGPGKHRSYHFDALSSPFVPWDVIAKRIIEAGDDPAKLKTLDNLTFGLAHEVKGDAPDTQRLMARREDYRDGHIHPRGLLLVAGADVQHSGIWVEAVAYASNAESWTVRHEFLEGDTTDHNAGAFLKLDEFYNRQFPDAFGATRQIDAMAVDAGDGGRSNQVYNWTRSRSRAFAIKGMRGWTHPSIGTPTKVDVTLPGKKVVKGGALLWPVGTWSLKATFYANLDKEGIREGKPIDPAGYCHHHMGCDERFFAQQTAEHLATGTFKGRPTREWKQRGPNHLLDCRIYAMAMADYLGLARMTPDQWGQLAQLRGVPIELNAPDLLAPDSVKLAASSPAEAPAPARPPLLGNAPRKTRRVLSRGIRQ